MAVGFPRDGGIEKGTSSELIYFDVIAVGKLVYSLVFVKYFN